MRRLYPLATWLLVLSTFCGTNVVRGDESEEGPRLLDASLIEGSKQVMPATTSPDEQPDGSLRAYDDASSATEGGSSLSDRLQEIRRRAVDDDISRPFQVETEKGASASQTRGAMPSVPRRSLEKPTERTSKTPQRTAAAPPRPTPATRPVTTKPVPTPAAAPQVGATQVVPGPTQPAPAQLAPSTPIIPNAQPAPVAAPVQVPALDTSTNALSTDSAASADVPSNDVPMQAVALPAAPQAAARQPVAIPVMTGNMATQSISANAGSQRVPSTITSATSSPLATPTKTRPIDEAGFASSEVPPAREDLLITNRAPSLSFETAGPKTIKIGQEATYQVTMINSGEVDAKNLVVTVQLPGWTDVTGHSASVGGPHLETDSAQNTLVRWHINELRTSGREKLQLKIVPRDSRPFDLTVGWTFAQGQSMASIEVQEPKLEMAIAGPDEVMYGENDTYTITLANPGTGDAENVLLQLLPLTPHQQAISARKFGTLKAGERKTVSLELTAHQAGRLQVQAVALADGGLRTQAGQDVIVRRANLEVAAAGPVKTFAGTEAVYRVRVENTGDAPAQESVAQITLPAGAKYLSSNDGGKFDTESGQVAWQIGALRAGAVRVLEVRCTLTMPGENRFEIRAGGRGDLTASQMVVTQVDALADLKLAVNDPQGAVPVGTDAVYEVKVINRGTRAAEQIQVVGYFAEGIEPVALQGCRGEVGPGQVVFEPIGVLAAGQEMVFKIIARASLPGDHIFRAEVLCASPETKLAHEESTKYYGGAAAMVAGDQLMTPADPSATLPADPATNGPVLNLR